MFASLMQDYFIELDATLRQAVGEVDAGTPGFGVMLRYAMGWVTEHDEPYPHPTGKRMRPLLLLLCTEAAGANWRLALPAAAAVELLHNFSLIHDDIQDSSPMRHGRPTVWKVWGIANAINAGDALFGLSYITLQKLYEQGIDPVVVLKTWRILNDTVLELTRGQHLDMRFETQRDVSVDDYISMIRGKSAALVAACAQMGAWLATGDEDVARHYANFGLNMGIAFQIRDDILGIWGDPSVTGKSTATDIASHKKSMPVLYGLSQSAELKAIYGHETVNERDVAGAVGLLDAIGAQRYAQEREAYYYNQALAALEAAHPVTGIAENLRKFIDTLFQRSY